MNSQSYKTTVGAFVLGGLALLVLGIMLLGGGRLFSNDLEYVMYFDGSVSGLSTGAPVVFRGVPMGSVTRINLVAKCSPDAPGRHGVSRVCPERGVPPPGAWAGLWPVNFCNPSVRNMNKQRLYHGSPAFRNTDN